MSTARAAASAVCLPYVDDLLLLLPSFSPCLMSVRVVGVIFSSDSTLILKSFRLAALAGGTFHCGADVATVITSYRGLRP